jgi:hypothetical protein
LRLAEWDRLFASSLVGVARERQTLLTLTLTASGGVAAEVRELAGRESSCCSFFQFTVTPSGERVTVGVGVGVGVDVPPERADALDWIEARAVSATPGAGR